jgi:hypothetical protein
MKLKKAFKKLTKIETRLSNVLDQYSANDEKFRGLLNSATESSRRAKEMVHPQVVSSAAKKPPVKAARPTRGRLSDAGRRNISRAAKERWATAKRKGLNAVTGRPLKQTA